MSVTPATRRRAVVELRAQGMTYRQIADALGMNAKTVSAHLARHRQAKAPTVATQSERQEQVAELRKQGLDVRAIAQRLGLSDKRVYELIALNRAAGMEPEPVRPKEPRKPVRDELASRCYALLMRMNYATLDRVLGPEA